MKKIIYALCMFSFILLTNSCRRTTITPTDPAPTSVTDIDGNVYGVVKIGNQYWSTENLRTTRYNDGTAIPTGLSNTAWSAATTGACAVYNDDPNNNTTYGKLYNWHAVNTGKLAPTGWHVPSSTEWDEMVNALGGFAVAGGKMKSTSSLWVTPNTGADNSSGFNALPSGYKGMGGGYSVIGKAAYWWQRDERNASQGNYIDVSNDLPSTFSNGATKTFGYAIRLVKD
ncbi:MAG TPA: fibrobacter succinogenes major paralogous domain-containing protein [Chitinophagaceae bacterium]|nr:fibrobacter succinogenes major paralogous domain-containing protein [Chitinophagaceae bacterium]